MKKLIRTSVDSIFAGVMIAIGAAIYLNCPNRIVGSFLFSIGLITIMELGFDLFTGRVGYIRSREDALNIFLILLMNAVGCLFVLLLPSGHDALEVWTHRLEVPLYSAFFEGVVCGILIYICVHRSKTRPPIVTVVTTLVAIPAFILCGVEHSIADICFMLAARHFTWEGILFILIVAVGNAVGALAVSLWVAHRHDFVK